MIVFAYFYRIKNRLMADFGENMLTVRKQKGMTQQELGKVIGLDKRVISKYENGQTIPSIKVAIQIAQALQVSLDYLAGSDKSLFIDDQEIIQLLKNYNDLADDIKITLKNMLKALTIYSKVQSI
jgi:transcriptional regulator with XRE-family HTH domain